MKNITLLVLMILSTSVFAQNQSKERLYIVNGEVFEGDLNSISPDAIEEVEVLKDKATKQYGEAGKNGVVVITTKNLKPILDNMAPVCGKIVVRDSGIEYQKSLIIVNGKVFKGEIDSIDLNTIEEITVLKGKTANLLVCNQPPDNGVLVITTKQASKNKKRKRKRSISQN